MWFVATLLIAIAAVSVYQKAERISEEVAIGCVAVAIACLFATLIAAPWPVQLVLLIVALGSYRFTQTRWLN